MFEGGRVSQRPLTHIKEYTRRRILLHFPEFNSLCISRIQKQPEISDRFRVGADGETLRYRTSRKPKVFRRSLRSLPSSTGNHRFPDPFLSSILPAYPEYENNQMFLVVFVFVRAGRIELPTTAWKAVILPLNHARAFVIALNPHQRKPMPLRAQCEHPNKSSAREQLRSCIFFFSIHPSIMPL